MDVRFRTRKLQSHYERSGEAVKAYGELVARKYIQRVNIIKAARDINELKRLPALRCHQLKGERFGQWAVNLTGYQRLIFTLEGDWLEIVMIEGVSKHYED
ncbi:MAG: type II toxin-antitoxin system RelE/ParE family toxin [Candidatus Geothermincolia bacterium]